MIELDDNEKRLLLSILYKELRNLIDNKIYFKLSKYGDHKIQVSEELDLINFKKISKKHNKEKIRYIHSIFDKLNILKFIDENRKGTLLIRTNFKPKNESDYAALGYYVGKSTNIDDVPIYLGLKKASKDELKLLAAASAASGSIALFHVLSITPEAKTEEKAFGRKKPLSILVATTPESTPPP